jgi:predicted transcriptional regulator YdeE
MKKIIPLLIGILIFMAVLTYIFLGKLQKTSLSQINVPAYLLVGKAYQGRAKDEKLGQIFQQTQQLYDSKTLQGNLVSVYYRTDGSVADSVNAFIGMVVQDSLPQLPEGFVYKKMPAGKGIRGTVKMGSVFALSPEQVQNEITDFARKQNMKLQPFVIEKYIGKETFEMEILLQ